MGVTGIVRSNRTGKCPLKEDKAMKKQTRGDMDYRFDDEEKILFVKWNDNSLVTVWTNYQSVEPIATAKRWSTSLKQEMSIPQPHLMAKYNKFMGGVGHLDWLVQKYRIGVRSKNGSSIFSPNAWILHSMVTEKPKTLLSFRCYVTKSYLKLQSTSDPKSVGV